MAVEVASPDEPEHPLRDGGHEPPPAWRPVASPDEPEHRLRDKARWYLGAGVRAIWIVLPDSREVVVVTEAGEGRHRVGERIPAHRDLPGLSPEVSELFAQLAGL